MNVVLTILMIIITSHAIMTLLHSLMAILLNVHTLVLFIVNAFNSGGPHWSSPLIDKYY